jgi:iron(III) transport system permease protein
VPATTTMDRPTSSGTSGPRPKRPIGTRMVHFVRDNSIALFIGGLLIFLVAGPIGLLFNLSIRGGTPAQPGSLTTGNFEAVYAGTNTWSALSNTLVYAGGVTIVSLLLATLFAWFVERTDMPGRGFAWAVMLIPLAMPGMLSAMSWTLMLSPKIGVVNVGIREVASWVGIDFDGTGPINIYSMGGMIFIEGVKGANTLFLMLVGGFRLMDPSLEDASTMSGASRLQTMRTVTMPLMTPALLAAGIYAFLGNLDDFDTPLLIGLPAGIYVLPTLIYFTAYVSPSPNWGMASAYASIFLIVMAILVVWYYKVVIKRANRYATVSGKGFKPGRVKLGRWRFVAMGAFGSYLVVTIVMPFLILLWASILPSYRLPSWEILHELTFKHYMQIFHDPLIVKASINTVVLATTTATATMVLAFVVSWAVVRLRVRGGVLMDALAFAPNAIPTVAVGLGLVVMYLHPALRWTSLYGSIGLLVIALSTKYLAFSTRIGNSAMVQVAGELEEASWMSGVGKLRTLLRVTGPLLLPTFLAGWLWVVAHSFKNLTLPLLLSGPNTEVLSMRIYQYWTREGDFSLTAALGVLLMLALAILAFASRRIIAKGFTGN